MNALAARRMSDPATWTTQHHEIRAGQQTSPYQRQLLREAGWTDEQIDPLSYEEAARQLWLLAQTFDTDANTRE